MSLRPYVPLPIDGRYEVKEENIADDSNGKKSKRKKVSQAKNFRIFRGPANPIDYAVSVWGQINNGGSFRIRKGNWKMIV